MARLTVSTVAKFNCFTFAQIPLPMQFVDVKNDVAFHKIFGDEKKTVILISFLNAIMQLKGQDRVESIAISNPYQAPILPNFKASIIDVRAKDFKGKTFIVEMQVADILGMDKRLLYIPAKNIVNKFLVAIDIPN